MTADAPTHEEHRRAPARSAWLDLCAAPDDGPPPVPLDEDTAWNWSLVLKAVRIPHRTMRREGGWRILVPAAHRRRAGDEIAAYERENPPETDAPPLPQAPGAEARDVTLVMLLALFHHVAVSNPLPALGLYPQDWMSMGTADSTLILQGSWWRAFTALTLHADPAHFLGNAALGGIILACLCRAAGTGAAWLLFVVSGGLGNLLNAWARGPEHLSIGASTAVFGVVGSLGALTMVREGRLDFRRAAAPVVAGLALLGMLGTGGERTDLGAHLFGFLTGLPLGLVAGRLVMRFGLPGRGASAAMGCCALGLMIAAWAMAFTA